MKVTFFSNYLSHHQIPLSDAIYQIIGDDYRFVSCEQFEKERISLGWEKLKRPYEIQAYESEHEHQLAVELAENSDIMIWGSAKREFLNARKKTGRCIVRYSERLFKEGFLKSLNNLNYFRFVYTNLSVWSVDNILLCASSYAPKDFAMAFGRFKAKYKWGYFPETKIYDTKELMGKKKKNDKIKILWVGRLIAWKHPEIAIQLAKRLRQEGLEFELSLVGSGPLESSIRDMITSNSLTENVYLVGSIASEEVRCFMEEADIHIITSDYNEGWGAVLNEAMNSGCAVVCSDAVGSAKYLIDEGVNGYKYRYGDFGDLVEKTVSLIKDGCKRQNMGTMAYNSIVSLWSSEIAAERLLACMECFLAGKTMYYKTGPMSRA